jgi:hypothetical protein
LKRNPAINSEEATWMSPPSQATDSGTEVPVWVDPPYTPPLPQDATSTEAKAFRILFVGNSITRHGADEITLATLKWGHVAGMAATSEGKDFAHVFGDMMQFTMDDRKVELYFDDINAVMAQDNVKDPIQGKPLPEPHLVIIQTGEHEGPGKSPAQLEQVYEKTLILPYSRLACTPRILCVGVWNPTDHVPYSGLAMDINLAYEAVCKKYGFDFVSVESIATDPSCHGWGETPGVKWHPNDKGMQGYARLLFDAYQK